MPYDKKLAARISAAVAAWEGISSRKMFGGVCHLLRGNMVAGAWKEFLIVRLGEDAADFARELPHVRPFDITGRPMKGWVMVEPPGLVIILVVILRLIELGKFDNPVDAHNKYIEAKRKLHDGGTI